MNFSDLLEFSSFWAPPKIDLRKAEILDSYGSEKWAERKLNHQKPADVIREDFEYYPSSVFCFMETEDLLFYTYSVYLFFYDDYEFDHIDSYIFNIESKIEEIQNVLSQKQTETFIKYSKVLYSKHGFRADWVQAQKFCEFLKIDGSEKAESKWYDCQPKP